MPAGHFGTFLWSLQWDDLVLSSRAIARIFIRRGIPLCPLPFLVLPLPSFSLSCKLPSVSGRSPAESDKRFLANLEHKVSRSTTIILTGFLINWLSKVWITDLHLTTTELTCGKHWLKDASGFFRHNCGRSQPVKLPLKYGPGCKQLAAELCLLFVCTKSHNVYRLLSAMLVGCFSENWRIEIMTFTRIFKLFVCYVES